MPTNQNPPHPSWNGNPVNAAFTALSDPLRRRVLFQIYDLQGEAADEVEIDELIGGSEAAGDMLIKFHHIHLPKLESAGFIDWDPDTRAVRKGPHYEQVHPLLDLLTTHADELPYDLPESAYARS